jgi:hypothetical protein
MQDLEIWWSDKSWMCNASWIKYLIKQDVKYSWNTDMSTCSAGHEITHFYGTRIYIALFTEVHKRIQYWSCRIQHTSLHHIIPSKSS